MWREIKDSDMQRKDLKFYNASDAMGAFNEMFETMNHAKGYDYSESVASDTTGEVFGLDEYLTLKGVFQVACRDVGPQLWSLWCRHEIGRESVRSLEGEERQAKKMIAIVRRAVETELRKRNMLKVTK